MDASTFDKLRDDDSDWQLRPFDVARIFGVITETVASWSDRGLLPSRRTVGGHRRYRRTDIDLLLLDKVPLAEGGAPERDARLGPTCAAGRR